MNYPIRRSGGSLAARLAVGLAAGGGVCIVASMLIGGVAGQRSGEGDPVLAPGPGSQPAEICRSVPVGQGRVRWRDTYRTGRSMQRPAGSGRTFRRWFSSGLGQKEPDAGYVKILG